MKLNSWWILRQQMYQSVWCGHKNIYNNIEKFSINSLFQLLKLVWRI